ncbi:pyruvate kinase [Roseimaritima ulvae]|uniref:Pyruvate kinase n=1 Tax=Roseimaritima ulvae TaxID=980254 RepID=A0A5B9QY50_9BACT|nr:pyruvate kinase [Roseimaritima ulvae]QEG42942.1 Pyruvate kinase [Roseimaritima ulvae]
MPRPTLQEASTKIIATVGPACDSLEKLVELIESGVDVFRINTAHGSRESHAETLRKIRQASEQSSFPVGVLLDLSGPKIRLGTLLQDPLPCEMGMELSFVSGDEPNDATELTSSYKRLLQELQVGDNVMLADGIVSMVVVSKTDDRAVCRVTSPGVLRSRQGINLPGVKLSVSSMRPEDVDNAIWGAQAGIDFISLSFVRSASDVRSLKDLLTSYESMALVIAKIEKREAMEDLDAIVEAADGVMVARGDLGVEIDVSETPVAQKRIIDACTEKMKPVIVATQMLDSMHHCPRPTRAEASDVANAILDGADCCMLSGETAIGDFPIEAVQTMRRIMLHTERNLLTELSPDRFKVNSKYPITSAVAQSAIMLAESVSAKVLVIATRSGGTAWVESKQRSLVPTLGVSDNEEALRRMNLFWGVKPVRVSQLDDATQLFDEITAWGCRSQMLNGGDLAVLVTGNGVMDRAHNLVMVHTVDPDKCKIAWN